MLCHKLLEVGVRGYLYVGHNLSLTGEKLCHNQKLSKQAINIPSIIESVDFASASLQQKVCTQNKKQKGFKATAASHHQHEHQEYLRQTTSGINAISKFHFQGLAFFRS
jgi:hypothetical protein